MASLHLDAFKFYEFLCACSEDRDIVYDISNGIQFDYDTPCVVTYGAAIKSDTFDLAVSCTHIGVGPAFTLVRDVFGLDPSEYCAVCPKSCNEVELHISNIPRQWMQKIDPDFEFPVLPATVTITCFVDSKARMAEVCIDDESVMIGNYHDFHPGCHGITEYGDFADPLSLGFGIRRALLREGRRGTVVRQLARFSDGKWNPKGDPEVVR